MAETFFRAHLRDDRETEIEVEIAVTSWGCAAHMGSPSYAGHPGEGMEIEIVGAWLLVGGAEIMLTEAEAERIETDFHENPPEPDYPDDD